MPWSALPEEVLSDEEMISDDEVRKLPKEPSLLGRQESRKAFERKKQHRTYEASI